MVFQQVGLHRQSLIRVVLEFHQGGLASRWPLIRVAFHQVVSHHWWSQISLIRVVSHQGGLSSGWPQMVSHQGGLSSGWSHEGGLIRVVSHQGGLSSGGLSSLVVSDGLSSGWSLIRVVSHQGGLSSGWPQHGGLPSPSLLMSGLSSGQSLSRVVSHQGGLLSGWSLITLSPHERSFMKGSIALIFSLFRLWMLPQLTLLGEKMDDMFF